MALCSPSTLRCTLMVTDKFHVRENVRYSEFLCVFSWSSWNSLQKMVCRLATELRAPCPIPADTHLLILQQLFAFVVWPSSRLAHRAGSRATVMPLYLHIDDKLNTICSVFRAIIVAGAVSRSVKFTVTGFANWIPQKVMWDKGCLSTEQTNKHPRALWSWDFSTIRKDSISQKG